MNKHWPILSSIVAILIFSLATSILNALDIAELKEELKQPKAVQIRSNGVISQWPVDGRYVKIVRDEYK